MTIIWIILVGFVVGLLAKMLTPGRDAAAVATTPAVNRAAVRPASQ